MGRAQDRAQHRPVPRRARHGAGRHRPGHGPPHRPLQVGQVHDRATRCTSAPRWPAGSTSCRRPLSAYGDPLGEAFQLRDDVLGSFGDSARHRQAGRRRPPRGQADADAGHRRRPGRRRPDGHRAARPGRRPRPHRRRGRRAAGAAREQRRPSARSRRTIQTLTERAVDAIDAAPIAGEARPRSSRWPTTWPPASTDRAPASTDRAIRPNSAAPTSRRRPGDRTYHHGGDPESRARGGAAGPGAGRRGEPARRGRRWSSTSAPSIEKVLGYTPSEYLALEPLELDAPGRPGHARAQLARPAVDEPGRPLDRRGPGAPPRRHLPLVRDSSRSTSSTTPTSAAWSAAFSDITDRRGGDDGPTTGASRTWSRPARRHRVDRRRRHHHLDLRLAVHEMLGREADDMIGRPAWDFIHPDDVDAAVERLAQRARPHRLGQPDRRARRRTPTARGSSVEIAGGSIRDANGGIGRADHQHPRHPLAQRRPRRAAHQRAAVPHPGPVVAHRHLPRHRRRGPRLRQRPVERDHRRLGRGRHGHGLGEDDPPRRRPTCRARPAARCPWAAGPSPSSSASCGPTATSAGCRCRAVRCTDGRRHAHRQRRHARRHHRAATRPSASGSG